MDSTSLNIKFHRFLKSLPWAQSIDDLELPSEFDYSKRADFLIENGRALIEIKSLEVDQDHKVHSELEKHKEREEYPLIFGSIEISKVLRHLPDGELIQKQLFEKVSRSIEQSFRTADKQIESTKQILNCQAAHGILVFLNDSIDILSPTLIATKVSQMLVKRKSDASLRYRNISSVWIIAENYSLRNEGGAWISPSIVLEGPLGEGQPELEKIFTRLGSSWADYKGLPFVRREMKKATESDFVTVSDLKKENDPFKERQDFWRTEYRKKPYLRSLSDEDIFKHGAQTIKTLKPHFLINGKKLPHSKVAQLMEGFTHFLEEANHRGLDMKNLKRFEID
jgi:hypothetical protein